MKAILPAFSMRRNGGGSVKETAPGEWRLEIPAGEGGGYRWAQLDDYMSLPRSKFLWAAPLRIDLSARVSTPGLPGTWGFGLWNDPFSASFGLGGMAARLPALPNAAWFFYAGPPNWLALSDDHPAQGFLAATFRAPRIPPLMLAPAGLFLPLMKVRPLARFARRLGAKAVGESASLVSADPMEWHEYSIVWLPERTTFAVDGAPVHTTAASPRAPLGLVLWIDNQYAAFPPSGSVAMGTSRGPAAWLDLKNIRVEC